MKSSTQAVHIQLRGALRHRWHLLLASALIAAAFIGAGCVIVVNQANNEEMDVNRFRKLDEQWHTAYAHANGGFSRVHAAFEVLRHHDSFPCSDEHVQFMRQVVMGNPAVEEVGYFVDGRLSCSSWSSRSHAAGIVMKAPQGDYTTPFGEVGIARLFPTAGGNATAVFHGPYNVLVNPERLLPASPGVDLELTTERGQLVAAQRASTLQSWSSGNISRDGKLGSMRLTASMPSAVATAPFSRAWHWLLLLVASSGVGIVLFHASKWYSSPLNELLRALRKEKLEVVFQPIVELDSRRWVAAEALLRWPLKDGTYVKPDDFIAMAEAAGKLGVITRYVVRLTLAKMGAVLREHPEMHVSINIGSSDLVDAGLLALLNQVVAQEQVSRRQVWLELTERGVLDIDTAAAQIAAVIGAGYVLAADDFGTGYSGLQNLNALPIAVVKLDRSFVFELGSNDTAARAEDIVDFVVSRGLVMIAEGVETEGQRQRLIAKGVSYGQGWFFAKAMPIEAVVSALAVDPRKMEDSAAR